MKIKKILIVLMILFVTNAVTFIGATALSDSYQANNSAGVTDLFDNSHRDSLDLEIIEEVMNVLDNRYIDEVDQNKLIEGAMEGMLEKLEDPQTSYLTPSDFENLRVQTEGSYGGIGIEVFMEDEYITILGPISGTPGEKAGLRSGDRIISVDGENIVGKDLDEAVTLMRGPEGSKVDIKIDRPGLDDNLNFEITREEIELETVEYETLENDLGYIEITNFSRTTSDEFEAALTDLQEQDMNGMVLDLRNNPGGLLEAVVDIGKQIVPEGPIVHVVGREGKLETRTSYADGLDVPVVVLVNEVSASASEILAGALQDAGAATVVGTETFGKASVQNIEPLSDGGALRYTMAKYQTPDGRDIHEEGIVPDVEVEPSIFVEFARYPISSDLGMGDQGEEVENLQKLLSEFGYYDGDISGYFGDSTKLALEDFQRDRDLTVSGEMSEMVIREIHSKLEELQEQNDNFLDKGLELLMKEVD